MDVSLAEHEAFFRDMLEDFDHQTISFDLFELQGDRMARRQASHAVDPEIFDRLRSVTVTSAVTVAGICHVAWACVLARISERSDIVFGTSRSRPGLVNVVPVRVRVDDRGTRDGVEQTDRLLAQLSGHERASITLADRSSAFVFDMPLVTALFQFRDELVLDPAVLGVAKAYRVALFVNDQPRGMRLTVETDAAFNPDRLCVYMMTSLRSIIDALEMAPERPLWSIDMMPSDERRQLLEDWNATERPYRTDVCVHELFETQAAASPDAVAVVHDGITLTYHELNAQANRLARHLRRLGVEPDTRVALCLDRSFEMVVALLAVLKAGGAYVPLDLGYPLARLSYMLEDSAPIAVLTHRGVGTAVHDMLVQARVPVIDLVDDADEWSSQSIADQPIAVVSAHHLAYVIYTSGSTGNPKGVMNEHRGVANRLQWAQEQFMLGADDAVLQKTPFGFDVSVWEFFWPLISGARLVMARVDGHQDPEYLAQIVRAEAITVMHFVPSMLQLFLEYDASSHCDSLKHVICSGEALPRSLALRFREKLPYVQFSNLYGPTEAAVEVTAWSCPLDSIPPIIPIGRPIANTRTYVLNDHMQLVPVGVTGELYIGGVQVARGYLNRMDLTEERFVPSPFVVGDRLYKTGDLTRYLPDGNIGYVGRNDFQVKIRGSRVELGEIEARLSEVPHVREAVVLAVDNADGQKRLIAYYTTDGGASVSVNTIRSSLLATMAEYMVPAAYVALPSLPLTPNGKLDRKSLPVPDADAYVSRPYAAPVGEIEETLAAIWCQLLNLERVGRHDNFFELGGHSLLLMRAADRLRSVRLHVDVRDLFTTPTLSKLASRTTALGEIRI